ncbi:MDR family MFS transporter [Fictibacillus iocasae]|uniref:MDR family MFS transporter n=1 Tax=Fictibacillus iocasae TaxID=2715437 RepID=A0ABW2NPA0_9BACL
MTWKEYPQNIKVRLITSFFNRAVASAVMPFMALFFAEEMSKIWAGIFLISTVVVGFIVNLIGGYISDRFPRKKVLMITSVLTSLMFLMMTISLLPEDKMIGLFALAYILFTITGSLGRPAMHALIIDSTTPENRKAVYTLDYWLINLSLAIGTTLGGLLYISHKVELFMMLTITSSLICVAYYLWLKDENHHVLKKKYQNVVMDMVQNYRIAFRDSAFVKVVIGSGLIFSAEFTLSSYIGIRLAESFETLDVNGFEFTGVHMLSLIKVQNMLFVVCFTFLVNRITDRFDKRKMLIVGLIMYGSGYAVVTSANIWYVLILFNVIATLGELIYSPIKETAKANMIPDDKRGSYSAFSNLSFSGADLIARSSIIIGAFLIPTMMSVYVGITVFTGAVLIYTGFFLSSSKKTDGNAVAGVKKAV